MTPGEFGIQFKRSAVVLDGLIILASIIKRISDVRDGKW
jgi:hypothetical protein